ncbi:hypothetical protein [Teichococcus aestuarii]|uniref:hypothetical protein n=1 Tax=Teichococcus aestuarii TaxID=568898 RepID=UPI003610F055
MAQLSRGKTPGRPGPWARPAGLALLLGLGACASSFTGDPITVPADSLTTQRILGMPTQAEPLMPVPGNVWPTEEDQAERPTLGTPDILNRPADPPPPPNRPIPRGSSTPPELLTPGTVLPRDNRADFQAPPPPAEPAPPPRRAGRVIPTPSGPAVTTTEGAGYSTYNSPGGGSGVAIPQGATTTLLGQDGSVRQVPTPR